MDTASSTNKDIARYRENYLVEMDGIAMYRAMAAAEKIKNGCDF